ncbi:hypothetical protein PBI_QUEENHAZEL_39 [Mycobacterium phage QueenHazel]|uniref:Uncharacterized protein n=1 Tax=Mycobacterium phage Xula TaxID=2599884 RepID=A0A5J6TJT8_9CAUD|nr:hypothetical protein KNU73_gp38 [Mycobacterium phage Xula]QFG11111.1 hypothetical protein PBI_XULA_38 [Mycobacterium phage Xula]QFG15047.1 hypothetical protein PBI_QUEENHAZEL_39 [Mycobacterium phage QueenHazel]
MTCPMCGRVVSTDSNRYAVHSTSDGRGDLCRMSRRAVAPSGLAPNDHVRRARMVMTMAWMLRDEDPAELWDWLTAIGADELQRLLVIALAAIDVEKSATELWEWVCALPLRDSDCEAAA